jgi:PAS domain S-box-containing protein
MQSEPATPWPLALLATALAYTIVGWVALLLAIPPGYASPLFPSAGIALASVMVFGWRMMAGVALGSFAINFTVSAEHGPMELASVALPVMLATGAALQAGAGAWLVKRFLPQPIHLTEPREIAAFFGLGGALACTIGATIAVLACTWTGAIATTEIPFTWWTWWGGDTLGVLIATPIALTLIARPRNMWAGRRVAVTLPLALASLLAALAIIQVQRQEEQRTLAVFERDAAIARNAVTTHLQTPLHALEAMRGLHAASEQVSGAEFREASRAWVEAPLSPYALGWGERVLRDELDAFEALARRQGLASYTVFDAAADNARAAPQGDEVIAVRHIEPIASNAAVLGVNSLSVAATRDAVQAARRADRPVASPGFRLAQEKADQTGVLIFRAVYAGNPVDEVQRLANTRGLVFVKLRMDDLLGQMTTQLPSYLRVCVIDRSPGTEPQRLAGAAGCESARPQSLSQGGGLEYAGRSWEVRINAHGDAVPSLGHEDSWLFSTVTLAAIAALSTLLLIITGRARRIETAVGERTAALQREIGERARTEAALRESEQRFRNILNHVPIGVIYTDLQGFIKESNPKFRELVGYTAEELSGMTWMQFTHPEERSEDIELSGQLVRGEISVYRRQHRFVTREGRHVFTRSIVSLLRDAHGQPHRIVGVVEDITEHLKLQEAEAARELAEANNRAKSDFLSRMSHELRTPLNAMLGFAQLIELDRQQALSESQRDWVGQIQTAGWHLLDMINDTLDLSRIESGTLRLDIEAMDLPHVITATVAMVDRAAQARGLIITQALDEKAAQASGDPTRVKQILTNLLTNAVKYNIDGGRIHIATRVSSIGAVELAVSDTGLGMSAEQLAGLFQPFNRLGRERSSQEGTGIGLVISQRLAELMGGSLRAVSTEGEGSSFILTLPRAVPRHTIPGEADALEPAEHDYRQRIVHYIEDNETNAVVMEGILAQRPQVRLKVSTTGLEGLSAIRAQPPSLILLDMHLPDIEGLQLLRMLKDELTTATIPVVVVSADAVAARIKAALEAGAESYLTKPVNVAELLRLIDELLESRDTLYS